MTGQAMNGHADALADLLFQDPATGMLLIDRQGWVERGNDTIARMAALPLGRIEGWPAFMLVAEPFRAEFQAMAGDMAARHGDDAFMARLEGTGLSVSVEATPIAGARGLAGGHLLRLRERQASGHHGSLSAETQKLQSLGQFTAGVAHDFNNLIGAMLGAVETLEAGCEARDDCQGRDLLAELRRSAMRGRALVARLLRYGRPANATMRYLPVDAAIADLADMLRRLFPPTIHLSLDLRVAEGGVRADPTQLDQVLVNLAINARDAMPEGGTLAIRSRKAVLGRGLPGAPGHMPLGSYVVVEMADTGAGIHPDVLPRIFQPFFTTRHGQGGNGLGLSTAREIVDGFGGFLSARSEMGRGTRMRVHLPWTATPSEGQPWVQPSAPARPMPAKATGERGAVLLVEDDPSLRKLAEGALRRAGWSVLCAGSGEAALVLASVTGAGPGRPSAMVTDIALPDMNGWVLAHAVRTRLSAPDLPLVLTSGSNGRTLAVEMARLGSAAVFLAKPYSLAELVATLEPFAHGPGPIDVTASLDNSQRREHISNRASGPGPRLIAQEALDVTGSAGGA